MSELSKENYDKLNENYLYKMDVRPDFSTCIGTTAINYHCKNWTFRIHKYDDGRAFMIDTYFNNSGIQVTDENIDDFKFVFDFREVNKIHDTEIDEYNEEDLYRAATNSGGYSCGGLYWVKKDTEKSLDKLINKKKEEIRSLKYKLEWAEDGLKRLLENSK